MKALIAALALATLISAPMFAHSANATPGKLDRDSYLSGQNGKCYWRGQCNIIDEENTRLHDRS
jgi:hypothetical protein